MRHQAGKEARKAVGVAAHVGGRAQHDEAVRKGGEQVGAVGGQRRASHQPDGEVLATVTPESQLTHQLAAATTRAISGQR